MVEARTSNRTGARARPAREDMSRYEKGSSGFVWVVETRTGIRYRRRLDVHQYFHIFENMNSSRTPAPCPPAPADAACCVAPSQPGLRQLKARAEHVEAFKALAHIDRLRVFYHLVRANAPLPANAIQAALELPGPTLSHHLDSLEQAGLITRTRQERFVLSAVRRELVQDLVRMLTACC